MTWEDRRGNNAQKRGVQKKGIRNSSVEIQVPGAIFRDKGARSLRGYFKHPLVLAPASGSTLNALGKFREGGGVSHSRPDYMCRIEKEKR